MGGAWHQEDRNTAGGEDPDEALKALQRDWADAYDVGCVDGRWRAVRLAGNAEPLTARTADELAGILRADAGLVLTPQRARALASSEPGQWERLLEFNKRNPKVFFAPDQFGTRSAVRPEPDGSTAHVIRHTIRELLDELGAPPAPDTT
jgi:hypothetical protein